MIIKKNNDKVEITLSTISMSDIKEPLVAAKISLTVEDIAKIKNVLESLTEADTNNHFVSESIEWRTARHDFGEDFENKSVWAAGSTAVIFSNGDLRIQTTDGEDGVAISEPLFIPSLDAILSGEVHFVERIEFIPAKCRYLIKAKSPEEALDKMEDLVDQDIEDQEAEDIIKTRYLVSLDVSTGITMEGDDRYQWTVDGKDPVDSLEEAW